MISDLKTDAVRQIVARQMKIPLNQVTLLTEVQGEDSLAFVELMMDIEDKVRVVPESVWDRIHTVGDLLRFLNCDLKPP